MIEEVAEYLAGIAPLGFSGSVLLAEAGEVLYSGAFGYASRVDSRPISEETVFDIGSISKQFTATALLALEEFGVDTSDRLGKYFPDAPADKRDITIHQLLTHTSGLPANHFSSDLEPLDAEQARQRIFSQELLASPGTAFWYSNSAYSLAAMIVEVASSSDFCSFIRERLFATAGVRTAGWYQEPSWDERIVAHGYDGDRDHGSPYQWPGPYWSVIGNGGVVASVRDLHAWVTALNEGSVVNAPSRDRLFTPYANEYAYGWWIRGRTQSRVASHTGVGYFGFSASVRYWIAMRRLLLILCNTSLHAQFIVNAVEPKVERLLDGRRRLPVPRPTVDDVSLDAFSGTYVADRAALEVAVEAGRLSIGGSGQRAIDLLCYSPEINRQHVANRDSESVVSALIGGDAARKAEVFSLCEDGASDVGMSETLLRQWAALVGRYGRPSSFEVLGTEPSWDAEWIDGEGGGGECDTTLVRICFDNATRCLRLVWRNGKICGIEKYDHDVELLGVMTFLPVSRTDFIGYHMGSERTAMVTFSNAAGVEPLLGIMWDGWEFLSRRERTVAHPLGSDAAALID